MILKKLRSNLSNRNVRTTVKIHTLEVAGEQQISLEILDWQVRPELELSSTKFIINEILHSENFDGVEDSSKLYYNNYLTLDNHATNHSKITVNPYHAEFLKWNNPPSIYGTLHFRF